MNKKSIKSSILIFLILTTTLTLILNPAAAVTYSVVCDSQSASPTVANATATFTSHWYEFDDFGGFTALGNASTHYIFSTNNTGSWVNDTATAFGSFGWATVTKTLNSAVGAKISYTFYANNTGGTWNGTSIQTITTTGYTITSSDDSHSSISPSGATTVCSRANQQYTFTADENYEIYRVLIDGYPISNTTSPYTFTNVTATHTIQVESRSSVPNDWTVILSKNVGASIYEGSFQPLYINVKTDAGLDTSDFMVNVTQDGSLYQINVTSSYIDVTELDAGSHTFNVTGLYKASTNQQVVNFTVTSVVLTWLENGTQENPPLPQHVIVSWASEGGTISPATIAGTSVDEGSNQMYNMTADEGYELSDVYIDFQLVDLQDETIFTFYNVLIDHYIFAVFTPTYNSTGWEQPEVPPEEGGLSIGHFLAPLYAKSGISFRISSIINCENGVSDLSSASVLLNHGILLSWTSDGTYTVTDTNSYSTFVAGSSKQVNETAMLITWTLSISSSISSGLKDVVQATVTDINANTATNSLSSLFNFIVTSTSSSSSSSSSSNSNDDDDTNVIIYSPPPVDLSISPEAGWGVVIIILLLSLGIVVGLYRKKSLNQLYKERNKTVSPIF